MPDPTRLEKEKVTIAGVTAVTNIMIEIRDDNQQSRECLAELENRRAFSENVTTGGQSDDHDVKRIQFKSKLAVAYFISHSSSRPDEGLCLDRSQLENLL